MKYLCEHCENEGINTFEIKKKPFGENSVHYGLYCKKCDSWLKWLSKKEIIQFIKLMNKEEQKTNN